MGNICYEDIEKAIRPNTKAIVTTHGSNLTGNLLDIQKIGSIAGKHGLIYIVDASQTAGVFDIDVQNMHIDLLCFTGHKGLLGPQGTGGLYVREGVMVRPLLSGGSGVQTYLKQHPPQMPTALEAGTLNGHGIAGLGAAVRYLQETGLPAIRQREQALMQAFYTQVRQIPGIIGGYGRERVIHCPAKGILRNVRKITDIVSRGETIALVETENGTVPVKATLDGILRGLIRDGYPVDVGFKMADIDPRAEELGNCFTISDKARCIAGGVLEAILQRKGELGL